MYICKICNKEYKSRSGLNKHMKSKHEGTGKVEAESIELGHISGFNIVEHDSGIPEKNTVIEPELIEYYEGHPRRDVKLRGMLSRTTDVAERDKIESILQGLSAGYDLATSNL